MMSPASGVAPHAPDLPPAAEARGGTAPERLLRTGIEVVGDVPWGTHLCQFYETADDLVDILVPYFREGLLANEFCMWITSAPLGVEAAGTALRAAVPDLDARIAGGQIEILDYRDWYVRNGRFDPAAVLDGWIEKLGDARRRGLEGLRLSGNTLWLEEPDWDDFYRYEEMIDAAIGSRRMLALCTYALEVCGAREIVDVVDNHAFALVRRKGRWEVLESAVQKRAREALRESEDRFRSLFASMSEGVALHELVYDDDGRPVDYRIVDANPAFERNTSIPVEQTRGALASRLYGTGKPPFFEVYRRVAETGVPESFTAYFPPLDRDFGVSVVPTRPGMFATVFQDVTEIRRAEEALREYAAELARSNEERQRFAYVASHDLQEPLRSIVSFSQLLERRYRGQLGEDADEFIGFIVEGGIRMQTLIRDLLQFARIDTRAQTPVPTDANRSVADALALFEPQIRNAGGSVVVEPLPTVMADPAQLEQVFTNLVSNAFKYRRPGVPPAIRVSAARRADLWEFAVADNGIGIEDEYRDRIFEMLRRLHTHDRYEGTGIGLAVVRKIVERHGGTVRVESTPGEGSTFFFTMPVA